VHKDNLCCLAAVLVRVNKAMPTNTLVETWIDLGDSLREHGRDRAYRKRPNGLNNTVPIQTFYKTSRASYRMVLRMLMFCSRILEILSLALEFVPSVHLASYQTGTIFSFSSIWRDSEPGEHYEVHDHLLRYVSCTAECYLLARPTSVMARVRFTKSALTVPYDPLHVSQSFFSISAHISGLSESSTKSDEYSSGSGGFDPVLMVVVVV